MKYVIEDTKFHFKSAFDTCTGAYVRTGLLDETGKDTGVDPFMASFPHLIDVGVMGHCIHGKTGLVHELGSIYITDITANGVDAGADYGKNGVGHIYGSLVTDLYFAECFAVAFGHIFHGFSVKCTKTFYVHARCFFLSEEHWLPPYQGRLTA